MRQKRQEETKNNDIPHGAAVLSTIQSCLESRINAAAS